MADYQDVNASSPLLFSGSALPIEEITALSHRVGAKVLVDACQSVPHMVVDVQKLDADFLVASSHKVCDFELRLVHNSNLSWPIYLALKG